MPQFPYGIDSNSNPELYERQEHCSSLTVAVSILPCRGLQELLRLVLLSCRALGKVS